MGLAFCVVKDTRYYTYLMQHIWSTDDDEMVLVIQFSQDVVNDLCLLVAAYLEFLGTAIILWTLYLLADALEFSMRQGIQQYQVYDSAIQGPFPKRPIDARPREIPCSCGNGVDWIDGPNVIAAYFTFHIVLDLIRYAPLFEPIYSHYSWFARFIAISVFVASLCYEGNILRTLNVCLAYFRMGLLRRQQIFEKHDG